MLLEAEDGISSVDYYVYNNLSINYYITDRTLHSPEKIHQFDWSNITSNLL